jgi:hypothetical protein
MREREATQRGESLWLPVTTEERLMDPALARNARLRRAVSSLKAQIGMLDDDWSGLSDGERRNAIKISLRMIRELEDLVRTPVESPEGGRVSK